MSSISIAFDILDDSASHAGKVSAPMRWLRSVRSEWLVQCVRFLIVRDARKNALDVEKHSLSLSGIASRIVKHTPHLSATELDSLLTSISRAENSFLNMRKRVMDIIVEMRSFSTRFPDIQESLTAWVESLADAFEASQELRWVILECQAQQDIDAGRVHSFDSAEEAIAALRS